MPNPTRMLLVGAAVVVVFTLGSGVLHGWVSQRWGPPVGIDEVASAVESLPEEIGQWSSVKEDEITERVQKLLRCEGFVNRVYLNERTKASVELYIILGPTGPIAVHQPEICFKSHAFRQREERKAVAFNTKGAEHELWALTFDPSPSNVDGSITRVYYAWTNGKTWQASSDPRFAFAGSPYLYKLQLSSTLPPSANIDEVDPCHEFLQELLPVLETHLRESEPS